MTGLIHLYCGGGKGKTTAAVGLTVRCAGRGNKVVFAQFLKDGTSGECRVLAKLPGSQSGRQVLVPHDGCGEAGDSGRAHPYL